MKGYIRVTKEKFYQLGGFASSHCVRVTRDGDWAYFMESLK